MVSRTVVQAPDSMSQIGFALNHIEGRGKQETLKPWRRRESGSVLSCSDELFRSSHAGLLSVPPMHQTRCFLWALHLLFPLSRTHFPDIIEAHLIVSFKSSLKRLLKGPTLTPLFTMESNLLHSPDPPCCVLFFS